MSAYLSYLFIASLLFTAISFSKFAKTNSSEDGARVAYSIVNVSGRKNDDDNIVLDSVGEGAIDSQVGFDKLQYEVTASNEKDGKVSEVDLEYSICIEVSEGFPTNMLEITVDDIVKDASSTDTLLVYKCNDVFKANTPATKKHTVTINHTYNVQGTYKDQDISIYVNFEQKK